ncbi:hypothetical protein FRC05_005212 [Tulasnella sp. 425]|nr:hypothetical protein FRC05_005212 [Tulasnella sp. 425]
MHLPSPSRVAIREKFNSPNQDDGDRAGTLSTGFEFAKFSRLNRKPRGAGQTHDRTTFVLSELSRPPPTELTAEDATELDVRDEVLRSKDIGDFISDASTNRQRLDSDQSKTPPNLESKLDGLETEPRRSRRNSEPTLTSSKLYLEGREELR